jgi:putative oxidoreductase
MQFPALADYADWGLLSLRLVMGLIFFVHGWPKVTKPKQLAAAMGGKPAMVAFITVQGLVETLGGIALALGIFTQLIAIAFAIIMIGAIILKNTQWNTGFMAQQTTGWEFDLILLASAILLLLIGPGSLAINY